MLIEARGAEGIDGLVRRRAESQQKERSAQEETERAW